MEKSPERLVLEDIVALLEPLYWQCPDNHRCQGCEFEHDEALTQAMNVIAGLDSLAHWGPPLRRGEPKPPGYEDELRARRERREDAWRKAGFVEDTQDGRTIWRRGTALD